MNEVLKNGTNILASYVVLCRYYLRAPGAVARSDAWYADGRGFDPHIRQPSFVEIGHEIMSTAILSLPLIQEGQLSVTGARMRTKYW